MNIQTVIAAAFVLIGIIAAVHLTLKVRRDWSDLSKRGLNIVFIIAIGCGVFVAGVSLYRVAIDLGIAR